jgi:tRNA threonylcarbamoyl adenosine modification protein (Sua5/YciO/YrdC/YwlC family)
MTKLLRIDAHKPDERGLKQIIDVLENDGVIIYPTDSVYTLGASIHSDKAFKRICQLKGVREDKAQFSIVCSDYSHLSEFAKQVSNVEFRALKKHLPGPFTFILEANKEASKIFKHNKKTIGFRIPDYPLVIRLIKALDKPLFSASIQIEHDSPYATTADEIFDVYDGKVDLIIDGGICGERPTTIVDLTTSPHEILREGAGEYLG